MTENLIDFDATIFGPDGKRWTSSACGRIADDGLWEGWIEFTAIDGSGVRIRTRRETEQPNRAALFYWATGLTHVYLDGALRRAIDSSHGAPAQPPS